MWDAGLPLPGTRGDRGRHPDPEAMELQEEAEQFSHAVQGTRKSLLQHHSSKASILWRSAFFTVQLSCRGP